MKKHTKYQVPQLETSKPIHLDPEIVLHTGISRFGFQLKFLILMAVIWSTSYISFAQRDGSNCGKAVILPAPAQTCKKELLKMEHKEKWMEFTANGPSLIIELEKPDINPVLELKKISLHERRCPDPPLLAEKISDGSGYYPTLEFTGLENGKKYLIKLENEIVLTGSFELCLRRIIHTTCQQDIFVCNDVNNKCYSSNVSSGFCYSGDNNDCVQSTCNILSVCPDTPLSLSLSGSKLAGYTNKFHCASWEFSASIPTVCLNPGDQRSLRFPGQGTYYLTVRIFDKRTGAEVDRTGTFSINVWSLPNANAGADVTITNGTSISIGSAPEAGNSYLWSPETGLNDPDISNPIATPDNTTTYILTVISRFGCRKSDTITVFVRNEKFCGTDDIFNIQKTVIPDFQDRFELQEARIRKQIAINNATSTNRSHGSCAVHPYLIPVVVHIVHSGETYGSGANISYGQIQSQIAALNQGFSATFDTDIQFCLARETAPSTISWSVSGEPGVMRYNDATLTHATYTQLGDADLVNLTHSSAAHFPFANYLNIWVVSSIETTCPGTQGYAPLPLTGTYPLDGIVIRSDVFGNDPTGTVFNLQPINLDPACDNISQFLRNRGNILVHEAGHYLNLIHTYHDGCSGGTEAATCELAGDRVCDTPPCAELFQSTDCADMATRNTCTEFPVNNPDPTSNYMYRAFDNCWTTFSQGQADRMKAFIDIGRADLISPENLSSTGIVGASGCQPALLTAEIETPINQICIGNVVTFTTPTGPGLSATSWTWDFGDGTVVPGTNSTVSHTYTRAGSYLVALIASDGIQTMTCSTTIFAGNCQLICPAQAQWYFGEKAGLDFSTGSPVAIVGSAIFSFEPTVTQSDPNGNLLFYSDGTTIWNDNNQPIPGTLSGNNSNSQILSVPNPADANQYFLLYNSIGRLRSTIVDIQSGNVTLSNINTAIPIPVAFNQTTGEQIMAIPHRNGRDFWIVTTQDVSANPRGINVYLLSCGGINYFGNVPTTYSGIFGHFKSSPDFSRLALAGTYSGGQIILMDFDNLSGAITNQNVIPTPAYGLEFSPNSMLLYASVWVSNGVQNIFQFDLQSNNFATQLTPLPGDYIDIQLGPDNSIYITVDRTSQLAVINDPNTPEDPNTLGSECGFTDLGPILSPGVARWGLPNMIPCNTPPPCAINFTETATACNTISFLIDPCWQQYAYLWNFGDSGDNFSGTAGQQITGSNNTTGTFDNPVHTYQNAGTYTVSLTMSINGCSLQTFTRQVIIQNTVPQIIGPSTICAGAGASYSVPEDPQNSNYLWTVSGNGSISGPSNLRSVTVNSTASTGNFTLSVSFNNRGCGVLTNSIPVNLFPNPVADAGQGGSICPGNSFTLGGSPAASGGTPPYDYLWDPAANLNSSTIANPTASPQATTSYTLAVSDNNGCQAVAPPVVVVVAVGSLTAPIYATKNAVCGDERGTLAALAQGGIPPYVYSWNDPQSQTTPIAIDLPQGTFTVSVTDASGCIATSSANVNCLDCNTTQDVSASVWVSNNVNKSCPSPTFLRSPCPDNLFELGFKIFTIGAAGLSEGTTITISLPNSMSLPNGISYGFSTGFDFVGLSGLDASWIVIDKNGVPGNENIFETFIEILVEDNTVPYVVTITISDPTTDCDFVINRIWSEACGCAIDPNIKLATPVGCGDKGIIEFQKLEYSIYFQNIGTGPAKDVLLRDLIDPDLMINTLNIISSSHTITGMSVDPDSRIFTTLFENIYLPPLETDPPGSIGSLTYSISPLAQPANGTEITNETSIIFDQNEAIVTNQTIHTIVDEVNVHVSAGADKTVFTDYPPYNCVDLNASVHGGLEPYAYSWNTGDTSSTIRVCPLEKNTYQVTVSYSDGCPVATDSVTVQAVEVRCGQNKEKIVMCHIPENNPSDPVTVCIDSSAVQTHLNKGDYLGYCIHQVNARKTNPGLQTETQGESISVNPNPVSNLMNFRIRLEYDSNINIELYDIQGRKIVTIFKGYLEKNKTIHFLYDTGNLKENIIISRITTERKIFNHKVIKTY